LLLGPLLGDNAEHRNLLVALGLDPVQPGAITVIIGQDHPIRVGVEGPFVLCPKGADPKKDAKSSLHNYAEHEVQKAFVENFLGNIGRFTAGAQGMNIREPPFLQRAQGLPLFNDVYCYLYFHVFAGCQKMGWLLPGKDWSIDNIFDRRVLKSDGTASADYMLSERLVAHWDFYIFTAIYASQTTVTAFREFYDRRVGVYRALNGKDGRVNWRAVLKEKLISYFQRFPDCCEYVGKRRKSGGSATNVVVADPSVDPKTQQAILDDLALI
jgi:hypothetical protein